MLQNRIFINLSLLARGKIKLREIPPKIVNRVFNYSRLARRAKRDRFAINEVVFRPIASGDEPGYLEFIDSYFEKDVTKPEKEISIPKYNGGHLCYVALCQNRIVAKVELTKKISAPVNIWQIAGLSVLPDFRGLGIGERIMKIGMSALGKDSAIIFLSVNKDNLRARKLYRKLGFKVNGEQERLKAHNIQYPPGEIIMTLDKALVKGV
jgi:ribosomal protein S18 acetylase RimI-like enzyme